MMKLQIWKESVSNKDFRHFANNFSFSFAHDFNFFVWDLVSRSLDNVSKSFPSSGGNRTL